jgi:hypothetical protein
VLARHDAARRASATLARVSDRPWVRLAAPLVAAGFCIAASGCHARMPTVSSLRHDRPREWLPAAVDLAEEPTDRLVTAHGECEEVPLGRQRTRNSLVCFAVDEALTFRRGEYRRRAYDAWFAYEPWGTTFVGTCADAHRVAERLETLLGPVELPDGTLPGWRTFAASGSFHREIGAEYLLSHVVTHAEALLSCEDGEGLRRALELFRDDLGPLLAAGQHYGGGGSEYPTVESLAMGIGRADLHAAHAIASSQALPEPWARALTSAGPPATCPATAQAIEAMLTASAAAVRIEGCACARRLDDRDPSAASLLALRQQLATFDAWTGTEELGPADPVTLPQGAGPLVTGLAGIGMLSSSLRSSTTTTEHHEVRRACADRPTPAKAVRAAPSVRVLGPGPDGLDYESLVVVWSPAADGTPDRRYCQRSRGPLSPSEGDPLPGFEWCPVPPTGISLGIQPLGEAGLPTHAGASTRIVLEDVELPSGVEAVSVSVFLGEDRRVIHSGVYSTVRSMHSSRPE